MTHSVEDSLAPGTELAQKYVVERELGRGGMGVVVAARHIELDETCAIKLLRVGDETYRDEMLARFRREARISAKVRSEHVLRVYDVGRLDDGMPFMVMELLDGEDLGTRLADQGALAPDEAVEWLLQACEGLAAIHAAGVVHRDLKPENLFLERRSDGSRRIKILDLGIAKVTSRHSIPDDGARLTVHAGAMGTPPYMAPEQITKPEAADVRSDIWAMGTVLYALLTGTDAFSSHDQHDSMIRILTARHTPLRSHRAELTPALEQIVDRCLQKDPSLRYQSVAELAAALAPHGAADGALRVPRVRRILGDVDGEPAAAPSSPAAPAPRRATLTPITSRRSRIEEPAELSSTPPRRRASRVGALAAGCVVVVAAAWLWRSAPAERADVPASAPSPVAPAAPPLAPDPREPPHPSELPPSQPPPTEPTDLPEDPTTMHPEARPEAPRPPAKPSPAAPKKPPKAAPPIEPKPSPPSPEDLFDDRK